MAIIIMAAAMMASLAACKEKKAESTNIIRDDYVAPKPTGPKSSSVTPMSEEITWVEGRHYVVSITGKADEALPMVQDANGQKYVDNSINIEISRADSTVFFDHTYTKEAFANWLTEDYRKKAILASISYIGIDSERLQFVVSLNLPDAGDDEATDLLMLIDRMGEVSIKPFTYNDRDDLEVTEE